MKIKILISYDGTDFCGWQKQKPHRHAPSKPSLQQTLEETFSKLLNQKIEIMGSGRTDAGVHALGQVAHFDCEGSLPKDLCWAIQSFLPPSISVRKAWQAPEDFHATLSAEQKTYRYWIWNRPTRSALLSRYSCWVRQPLPIEKLNALCEPLIGEKDFKSFQSAGTPVAHTVRTIYKAQWSTLKSGILQFEVTGSGFLKQMVRNIVGTQVDLAKSNQPIEIIDEIIKAQDRKRAGTTAQPQGLFLCRVKYPQILDNKCRQL
jgi:tRNA pseudouridine38-40 synthase